MLLILEERVDTLKMEQLHWRILSRQQRKEAENSGKNWDAKKDMKQCLIKMRNIVTGQAERAV